MIRYLDPTEHILQELEQLTNLMKVNNLFFLASNGRVNNLMHRNGFWLLCKITTAQQDHQRLMDKLTVYIMHACRLSVKYKLPPSSIIVMDETSVWNNMVSNTVIDKQVAKFVCLKNTRHKKCMVSVC